MFLGLYFIIGVEIHKSAVEGAGGGRASSGERVRNNPGINPLELMLGMNVNKGLNEI